MLSAFKENIWASKIAPDNKEYREYVREYAQQFFRDTEFAKIEYQNFVAENMKLKEIANKYGFALERFHLANPNYIQELKEFIEIVKNEINPVTAEILALLVAEGINSWDNIFFNLYAFHVIFLSCGVAIDNFDAKTTEQKADIVFAVLQALNGRNPNHTVYDSENRTLSGAFQRIYYGIANGVEEIADCKPLTLIFYFTMTALGEKVTLHLTSGDSEGHMYAEIPSLPKNIRIYENTKEYADRHNLVNASLYYDTVVDIQAVLVQEFVRQFNSRKSENRTDIEQEVRILEQFRNSNAQNMSGLIYLSYKYRQLLSHYYHEGRVNDLRSVALKRESIGLHCLKILDSITPKSEELAKKITLFQEQLSVTEEADIFDELFKMKTLPEKEISVNALLKSRDIERPF